MLSKKKAIYKHENSDVGTQFVTHEQFSWCNTRGAIWYLNKKLLTLSSNSSCGIFFIQALKVWTAVLQGCMAE